jgi:CRP/FNR family transcriptional regulator
LTQHDVLERVYMVAPLPFSNPQWAHSCAWPPTPTIWRPTLKVVPEPSKGHGAHVESVQFDLHDLPGMVAQYLPIQRRLVRAGDAIYRQGDKFTTLHLIHAGLFKVVSRLQDGRERIVHLGLKGDWLGLDGLAAGVHDCEGIALDTGEIWGVSYESIVQASATHPSILSSVLTAACLELVEGRALAMALCTLPARARVAQFLRNWVDSLEQRGLRSDGIKLQLSREDIGKYLGMTLETVSRALTQLARDRLIQFSGPSRREVHIPDVDALDEFIQGSLLSGAELAP